MGVYRGGQRKIKELLIAFRRCKNLKDILVRARLSSEGLIKRDVLVVVSLVVKCVMFE